MKFSFKKLALTALTASALVASPAFAEKTIRLAHLNPDSPFDSHSGAMAAVFKSLVETGTNGSLKVELFPNGQLGKDNEVIQQERDGLIQSVISSSGGMAAHYPLVGVFDMPFAFPNIAVAQEVIHVDSPFGQKLAADIEAKTGLKVLGLLDSGGFFAISNSKRPIKTLADMEGLRIRTMTLPTHEATIASLGGQPTQAHWRGTSMIGLPGHNDLLPRNALQVVYRTNTDALHVQHRSLLNMQLHECMWLIQTKWHVTSVTNSL
jgi:TRAP-type C4-dicarboxylate transport system substrate-binding protein